MSNILIIIAPNGYQDIEYEVPKKVLENSGVKTKTACKTEIAKGSLGGTTKADLLLKDVNVDDFDGVIFVGGPGSHEYFDDKQALKIAKEFYEKNKLTCAICAAPSILANAGLLEGKTATCFPAEAENLKSKKANYTGNAVEQDGLIITADGPPSAKAFGEKILQALKTNQ